MLCHTVPNNVKFFASLCNLVLIFVPFVPLPYVPTAAHAYLWHLQCPVM